MVIVFRVTRLASVSRWRSARWLPERGPPPRRACPASTTPSASARSASARITSSCRARSSSSAATSSSTRTKSRSSRTRPRGRDRQRRRGADRQPDRGRARGLQLQDAGSARSTRRTASPTSSRRCRGPARSLLPALSSQETDVYFQGETVEKIGPKKYKITNGGFTTCVQPTPRWDLHAGHGRAEHRRLHPAARAPSSASRASRCSTCPSCTTRPRRTTAPRAS